MRNFFKFFVSLVALFFMLNLRAAYPEHPIRLVIGFPPGTATDIATRIIASRMSEILNQQVVVDNKPGAGTDIAGQIVARSNPDGYTLFMAGNTNSVNPALLRKVPFDILNDFSAVGLAASVPSILVVNPNLEVSTLNDLIDLIKSNPKKIYFASSGNGTMSHLSGELFGLNIGAMMVHIPYKGSSQAISDLLSGNVPVMFAPASTVLPFIKNGKLKSLATTGIQRSSIAPDLPTVNELAIKGFDTRIWFGIVAPKGTPPAILLRLRSSLDQTLSASDVKDQLFNQGIEPFRGDGKAFEAHMASELKKWTDVIVKTGIVAD